jgi:hypothetical protein
LNDVFTSQVIKLYEINELIYTPCQFKRNIFCRVSVTFRLEYMLTWNEDFDLNGSDCQDSALSTTVNKVLPFSSRAYIDYFMRIIGARNAAEYLIPTKQPFWPVFARVISSFMQIPCLARFARTSAERTRQVSGFFTATKLNLRNAP